MKEKIIEKATGLFLKLGFKSVTMDDIANELAISKKTIYTHYKNKTSLVKEVCLNISEVITYGIDCICAQNQNPIEELYEIKKFVMLQLNNEKASPQYQLQKYYPEISETLKEKNFDKMIGCTRQNLQRGIAQGLYRNNIDIDFISRLYFLSVYGLKDVSIFPESSFNKNELMEKYLEYHIRGIVTKEGLLTLNKFIKEHYINV